MSWNNQGGPWGSGGNGGGQGPWGGGGGSNRPLGGGGGNGPTPPDIEELLRKSQDKFKNFLPGGGPISAKAIILLVLLVFVGWMATGFYKVSAGQQGVQLLFGRFVTTTQPGLHWNFPVPIGTTYKPNVTQVRETSIGYRGNAELSSSSRNIKEESMMLTGDQNIASVDFSVFWRIGDAAKYLFNIRDPEQTVKAATESAMREVIGQMKLELAMTQERGTASKRAFDLIQKILDEYGSGIILTDLKIRNIDPPQQVIEAFNDVQRARQDKERKQNEAQAYRNRIVPFARGEAQKIQQEAEAYKERVIKDAEGEAKRFLSIYDSYAVAKDVTKQRLFLETMQEVLRGSEKVIIDNNGQGGVVPYLPLPELKKRQGEAK